MNKVLSFFTNTSYGMHSSDTRVDGTPIQYGVVNEREVRAVAGLMFAIGLTTVMVSTLTHNFTLAQMVLPTFFTEFFLKVFFGPQYGFLRWLVLPIISHLPAEWVGAIQKRFAWTLGMLFAGIIMLLLFGWGIRGPVPMLLCSVCLVLMWLESAAGICIGCEIYALLIKKGYIPKTVNGPKCAGGVCEL